MMPIPWIPGPSIRSGDDLATDDARRYLRHELGGDLSLLYERHPRSRSRPFERLRAWLFGPDRGKTARSASTLEEERGTAAGAGPGDEVLDRPSPRFGPSGAAKDRISPDLCPHLVVEDLGRGPRVAYSLCLSCGSVIVGTARGGWILPPIDPRDRREQAPVLAAPLSTYP